MTQEAAAIAMADFRLGARTTAKVHDKAGGSPVTDADLAVDCFLARALGAALPQAGWLSEETTDDGTRLDATLCWIVDPIDGTRAFLTGDPNWTISIALVHQGRPIVGVVHAPALDLYYDAADGEGARLNGKAIAATTAVELRGARTAGPKNLLDMVERTAGTLARIPRVPSLALRLARVGDGQIDLGLVSASAWDWDIAGADLIIHEAGGVLSTLEGARPIYNLANPEHDILVAAGPALHPLALDAVQRASAKA